MKIVNFLDITLDLTSEKYQPYKKPNDDTLYINSHSNHPPSIINSFQSLLAEEFQDSIPTKRPSNVPPQLTTTH